MPSILTAKAAETLAQAESLRPRYGLDTRKQGRLTYISAARKIFRLTFDESKRGRGAGGGGIAPPKERPRPRRCCRNFGAGEAAPASLYSRKQPLPNCTLARGGVVGEADRY